MNLIGNCCISNFLLRLWGFGNTNPFTWADLDFNSFYYLLTNWENINFDDVIINREKHPYVKNAHVYEAVIEDKVHIRYIHCMFDKNAQCPKIIGHDVRYCRIWEYVLQKYNEHVRIMKDIALPPAFVLEWEHMNYDEAAFEKLLNTDLKYKVVVITYNKKFMNVKKKNLLVIYDEHMRGNVPPPKGSFPDYFGRKYNTVIREFLK